MDGASKFVRGDSIAGILILFINIIGGLIVGLVQHHLEFQDALQNTFCSPSVTDWSPRSLLCYWPQPPRLSSPG